MKTDVYFKRTISPGLNIIVLIPNFQVMVEFAILILTASGAIFAAFGIKLVRMGFGTEESRHSVFWGAVWIVLGIAMFILAYWVLLIYAKI